MKILFFGDFHFGSRPSSGGVHINYATPVAEDPMKSLIEPLKIRYDKEKIDLMVFMGDYGNGKDPDKEKEIVFRRIEEFVKKVEKCGADIFTRGGNLKDRIVFLDGNHDVLRNGEHHQKFEEVFGTYLTPFTQKTGNGVRKYGAPVFDFENLDLQLACISTTQNAGAYFEQGDIKQIKECVAPLEGTSKDNYNKILKLLEQKKSVDIGSVTEDTTIQFKRSVKKARSIKIVVSHHPLIQMQHATAAHFETVNGPLFFDKARAKGFTYFVSAHLHEFYCVDITSRGKSSSLPAATLISVPKFGNLDGSEIRFVELDVRNTAYSCHVLTYNRIRDMIEEVDVASNEVRDYRNVQGEHTLLDYEIQALIEEGDIIKGASTDRIQSISYDCALGLFYKRYDEEHNTWPDEVIKMEVSSSGPACIEIGPNERVLLYTHEEFCIPPDMMLRATPRASWNRKGIIVDLSFVVDPGFVGPFCFPVTNKNKHPIKISAQEAIMSVTFHRLVGCVARDWKERTPEALERRKNKRDK